MQLWLQDKLAPSCAESLTNKHLGDERRACVRRGIDGVYPLTGHLARLWFVEIPPDGALGRLISRTMHLRLLAFYVSNRV
jgi:hypothetical protein